MPSLTLNSRQCAYATEGEGFPLILVPDTGGTISDWAPSMPLLGELCRVVAYEYTRYTPAEGATPGNTLLVEDLAAFLDTLKVERAYLAGYAGGGQTALHFALRHPGRVEGLLLIGMNSPDEFLAESRREITMPILLLVGGDPLNHAAHATPLAAQRRRCTRVVLPGTSTLLYREQPLRLGHAMLNFLMQCERQRNLVRGASFLL